MSKTNRLVQAVLAKQAKMAAAKEAFKQNLLNKQRNRQAVASSAAAAIRSALTRAAPKAAAPVQTLQTPADYRREAKRLTNRREIASAAQAKFRIGAAGIAMAEAMLDPFDDDKSQPSIMAVAAHIADHDGRQTWLCTAYGSTTIQPNANGGVFMLPGLCRGADTTTIDADMVHLMGADPLPGNTPTSRAKYNCDQAVPLGALLSSTTKYRPISFGIKVNATSPDDDTSGSLQAWLCTSNLRSADNTMGITYGTALTQKIGRAFTMKEGITVRRPYRDTDRVMTLVPQYSYNAGALTFPTPAVAYSGAGVGTYVNIQWIYHYEIECQTAMPFSVTHGVNEPDFDSIIAFVNERPLVSAGHSFTGFLGEIWGILKKVASVSLGIYAANRLGGTEAASGLANMAAAQALGF